MIGQTLRLQLIGGIVDPIGGVSRDTAGQVKYLASRRLKVSVKTSATRLPGVLTADQELRLCIESTTSLLSRKQRISTFIYRRSRLKVAPEAGRKLQSSNVL